MSTTERKRQLYLTPPLHDEEPAQPFHADPTLVLAVVEGTCELLGWKDYARSHAASVIRAVIEKSR